MERDKENNLLIFDPCEQRAAELEREIRVNMAPGLMNHLIEKTQESLDSRHALNSLYVYDIHPTERQTLSIALENRLATLARMQKQLGELAGEEIIQASLETAEEFRGLIDLGSLYQK